MLLDDEGGQLVLGLCFSGPMRMGVLRGLRCRPGAGYGDQGLYVGARGAGVLARLCVLIHMARESDHARHRG